MGCWRARSWAVPQAKAAGIPLFADTWNTPADQVSFAPDASGTHWATTNLKYNSPCPVPFIFQGNGPDGGAWAGQAGWYDRENGACTGSTVGQADMTAVDINGLQLCSTDPFGTLGRVCQAWQRNNTFDAPVPIEPSSLPRAPESPYTLIFDQNGEPHFVLTPSGAANSGGVSVSDNGDTALVAAEGITGGKPANKVLLSRHGACSKPLRRALGAEVSWMQTGLDQVAAGASTAGQRQAMAAAMDREASLERSLAKCLSNEHYRGRISAADFAKAQASLAVGPLPAKVTAALQRAGAKPDVLDVIRFVVRGAQPADLTGKLASKLKSHARATSLRSFAAELRH